MNDKPKTTSNQTPPPEPKLNKPRRSGAINLVIGFVLGLAVFWAFSTFYRPVAGKNQLDTAMLYKVQSILRQKYDGEIDYGKFSEGAAAGAVASLGDPYTVFLDQQNNKELADDLKGELTGVGIEVGQKDGKLTVIAPFDGTPASKAGIRAGDIIATIDGEETSSLTIDQAVNKIRGEKGTVVKLGIIRAGELLKEIEITRELISIPSVSYEMKDGKIGYIKIRRFGEDTASLVKSAGASLKSQGAKAVIVDVRDNPGGYLESAVEVASQFANKGVIVEERSRNSKPKLEYAIAGGTMIDIPVIMLINGGSASASEILAGALNDNDRATLVGEKTYGKGSVQEVVCLSPVFMNSDCPGASLKVTIARWFTPAGINISKEGIKPEVEVKLTDEDINNSKDPQLEKAIELAKQAK
jgi:carboxyl-terminal processing protease